MISNSMHLVSTISPDQSLIPRQMKSSSGSNPRETTLLRVRHTLGQRFCLLQTFVFLFLSLLQFGNNINYDVFLIISAFSPKFNWKLEPLPVKQLTNTSSKTKPVDTGLNPKDKYNGNDFFYLGFCINVFRDLMFNLLFRVHIL